MKAVVTGANGTVGSALVALLKQKKVKVIPWNRKKVAIDDYYAMEDFISTVDPDIVFHLAVASESTGRDNEPWLVNYEWASELAWITRLHSIKFIFTSTAMVFSDDAKGPFTVNAVPDASQGYGFEKRRAEERVFYQNPDARVVRLGWQIGDAPGSNNMIDFFAEKMKTDGEVDASDRWYPACSFLPDTVEALWGIAEEQPPGLYMIDANEKWTFFEIASALNTLHGKQWKIRKTDDFEYDQRLLDPRIEVNSLKARLPKLKG